MASLSLTLLNNQLLRQAQALYTPISRQDGMIEGRNEFPHEGVYSRIREVWQ
jgi:hypothetical protein